MSRSISIFKYGARLLAGVLALLFFAFNSVSLVAAASLAQGYQSNQTIPAGAVVSLTKSGSNQIQLTDNTNENLILGVAVDSQNAIVDLQPTGSDVRVAISGEIPIFVTNEGGDIKTGDNLIISNIAGVAMKDSKTSTAKKFIGVASESFSSSSVNAKQVSISQNGTTKTVSVGLIKAKVLLSDRQPNNKPNPIINFVQNLVGHPVATAQIIGAVAVFITTFTFTGLLLNGSIRGAFVSIGRNPLSKPSIISNMLRVSFIGFVILIVGTAMAYAILLI